MKSFIKQLWFWDNPYILDSDGKYCYAWLPVIPFWFVIRYFGHVWTWTWSWDCWASHYEPQVRFILLFMVFLFLVFVDIVIHRNKMGNQFILITRLTDWQLWMTTKMKMKLKQKCMKIIMNFFMAKNDEEKKIKLFHPNSSKNICTLQKCNRQNSPK